MAVGPTPDVEHLLSAARQGRPDCLGVLLQRYRNYLLLLAQVQIRRHLKQRVSPSDVVQQTFLRACEHFGQFAGQTEAEWEAWLRSILVSCLVRLVEEHLKAKKRDARRDVSLNHCRRELEQSAADLHAALAGQASSPSLRAERRDQAVWVAEQLARLPADYREVIRLRHLEELSTVEIARLLGRSEAAVRKLWGRGLAAFRQLLQGGAPP
jgi:RNA polymerase sigma-70 factor, ECF subfamily